jgi:PPE-repeat protein
MAFPPEVHSVLLTGGPGPGALQAAAGAWTSLSAEYASVADELSAVLADVQAGVWQGPSAESFVAAFVPFLGWLAQASADSSAAAARHETAAAAYTAALAAMPTLPELAGNHVVHGVLVATNFFGLNTIPIALNEADYVRMWVQAATTMSTYQAVAGTAVASTPQTGPAPQIQKSSAQTGTSSAPQLSGDNPLGLPQWLQQFLNQFGIGNTQVAHDPHIDNALDQFIANILQNFGVNWNPAQGTVNGATYDSYVDPSQPIFYVVRALEVFEDFQQFGTFLTQNPVEAFQYLISLELFDWPLHIEEIAGFLSQSPALLAAAAPLAAAPVGAAGGLAGLAGLAAIPPQPAVAPALTPAAALPTVAPLVGSTPFAAPAPAAAAPAAPAPAPATSAVAGPAPPAAPPAAAGPGFFPPYVVGGPTMGSGMSTQAKTHQPTSRGASKTPTPAAATAAAGTAAAREQARARRRRRMKQHGDGDEFMDMNIDVDPDWDARSGEPPIASTVASDRGAGTLGFAGTVSKDGGQAAGLAMLSDDEFGGGPKMPMLPHTWDPEAADGEEPATPAR